MTQTATVPFAPGQVYRRRDLHAGYGGRRQGGISIPRHHPLIMMITGESGEQYGYPDCPQPDGTYWRRASRPLLHQRRGRGWVAGKFRRPQAFGRVATYGQ